MSRNTFIAWVFCLLVFPVAPGLAQNWSAGILSDYETTLTHVAYQFDPNAAVGVAFGSDSDVEGTHLLVGPIGRIDIGAISEMALSQILPPKYLDLFAGISVAVPVRPCAQAALLWDLQDKGLVGVVGAGFVLFPENRIQPTFMTSYWKPAGNIGASEQIRYEFGVTVRF